MPLLFVYGSLKSYCRYAAQLNGQKFLGEAFTAPHYQLYKIAEYPGLVDANPGQSIQGELYEVDSKSLAKLHDFEGTEYEYRRIQLLEPWSDAEVMCYYYLHSIENLLRIPKSWNEYWASL